MGRNMSSVGGMEDWSCLALEIKFTIPLSVLLSATGLKNQL
jgi:hypothetical protein